MKAATTAGHAADHSAVVGIGSLSAAKSALTGVQFDSPVAQTCTLNLFATDLGNNGLPFPALLGPDTEIPHFQFDTASTTFDVSGPSITVTNVPSPTSIAPPGGSITHTVTVTNTGPSDVLLDRLADNVYGDVTTITGTTCTTGNMITTTTPYRCTFPGSVSGSGGETSSDTLTTIVQDDNVAMATLQATANVSITGGALPSVSVGNTVTPTSVVAPGGTVTHTVTVTNTSSENETLTALTDDLYNPLTAANTTCDTKIGLVLAPSGLVTCTFDVTISGAAAGEMITDTLTATVTDPTQQSATNTGMAIVAVIGQTALVRASVTSVSPNTGPTTGGQIVTITGSGFTGATRVLFRRTPAASFTVDTDTQITAVTPAGAAKDTVQVRVHTTGLSAKNPGTRYHYR